MAEGISTDSLSVAQVLAAMELTVVATSDTSQDRTPEKVGEAFKTIYKAIVEAYGAPSGSSPRSSRAISTG